MTALRPHLGLSNDTLITRQQPLNELPSDVRFVSDFCHGLPSANDVGSR